MQKTKGELLGHYAEKDPTAFYQFDGFLDARDDYVIQGDDDGDGVMCVATYELMFGSAVRILIKRGTTRTDALRLLKKMQKDIKRGGFDWHEQAFAKDDKQCEVDRVAVKQARKAETWSPPF